MARNRRRPAVPCPAAPAAPARATARRTCQRAGAKMCMCRACAVQRICVLECASWACTRVCSRARVVVRCTGAAGWARRHRTRLTLRRPLGRRSSARARPTRHRASDHCSRKLQLYFETVQTPVRARGVCRGTGEVRHPCISPMTNTPGGFLSLSIKEVIPDVI